MPLSVEQADALAEETNATEPEASVEDPPASGAQPVEEQATEPAEKTEPEKDAEKPKDEKPKEPEEEKKPGWKAVEIAKREQLKIAEQRRGLEAREQQIVEREQRFNAQIQRLQSFEGQLRQRAAFYEGFERALEDGDIETLQSKYKLNYETLTRHAIENGDPGVRAQREVERLRKEREEETRRATAQAQIQETRAIAHRLVQFVEESAEDFPELAAWTPQRIAREGIDLRDEMMRRGVNPSYDYVMQELQKAAKAEVEHAKKIQERLGQRQSAQTSGAGGAGKVDPKGGSGSPGTPALSAKQAVERASPPKELTEEEKDELCLSQLRGLKR